MTDAAITNEEREEHQGVWSSSVRFENLCRDIEKRLPHPNPFDSTRTPESYYLEALDSKLAALTALEKERDEMLERCDNLAVLLSKAVNGPWSDNDLQVARAALSNKENPDDENAR